MTQMETCRFDGKGTLHIDDPRIEAKLLTLAHNRGVSVEDALETALDRMLAERVSPQT